MTLQHQPACDREDKAPHQEQVRTENPGKPCGHAGFHHHSTSETHTGSVKTRRSLTSSFVPTKLLSYVSTL